MKSKTFNIGEYAVGGVISVEIDGKAIRVISRTANYKVPNFKESDQSKQPARDLRNFEAGVMNEKWRIDEYLNSLTSSYYAGQILEYINENCNLL